MPETVEQKFIDGRKIVQGWFHSRKALLLLVTFVIATVALFVGKLDADHWVQVIKWAVPAYMMGNVGDSVAAALKGNSDQ